jgi:hypothetical protein
MAAKKIGSPRKYAAQTEKSVSAFRSAKSFSEKKELARDIRTSDANYRTAVRAAKEKEFKSAREGALTQFPPSISEQQSSRRMKIAAQRKSMRSGSDQWKRDDQGRFSG